MSAVEARSTHIRQMSSKKQRAMGLPSDNECTSKQGQQDNDDDNFDSENEDDDELDTDTPSAAQRSVASSAPPVPSTPVLLTPEVQSLKRSQLTASLASQVSGAASFSMTAEEARHTKFDACFNMATSTNKEVLGEFHNCLNRNVNLMFCREAGGYMDLTSLPTFHNATCYHYQEGSGCLCLYMHHVHILLSEVIGLHHTNLVILLAILQSLFQGCGMMKAPAISNAMSRTAHLLIQTKLMHLPSTHLGPSTHKLAIG